MSAKLNQSPDKYVDWQATIAKLNAKLAATQNLLKDAEMQLSASQAENKVLVRKHDALDESLQWAVNKHQDALGRLREFEKKHKLDQTNLFEHCHRLITDNKKRQWCTMCLKPGGRYFCTNKCEDNYWYVLVNGLFFVKNQKFLNQLFFFFAILLFQERVSAVMRILKAKIQHN